MKKKLLSLLLAASMILAAASPAYADGIPSSEDAIFSSEDVIPSSEDVIPPGEDAVPSGEDVIPSGEDVIPSGEDVIPSGEDVIISNEDAAPAGGEADIFEEFEELEAFESAWEVGSVGDAELTIGDSAEELLESGGSASVVGVTLETGTGGLPVLSITLNGTTLDEIKAGSKDTNYKGGTAEISDGSDVSAYEDTTIKGRGNSTWNYPKKPFQLKFSKKQDLFGQGKAKKWILLANYADFTYVRNDIALRLAHENGIPGALPQGRFIEVCFDGVYEGLYYLTRKVETASAGLSDDNGILVEIEQNHTPDDLYAKSDNGTTVMLKETVIDSDVEAEQQAVLDGFMAAYNAFENAARDKDWETVTSLADVDSFARFFLLADFSGDLDMFGSSCYMFKDGDADVIHAGPMWDFDMAYGNQWSTVAPEISNPYRTWAYMDPREMPNAREAKRWSPVCEYLMNMPEFRELVRNIYHSSIRSSLTLIDDYAFYRGLSIEDATARDLAKWHPAVTGLARLEALQSYMQNRLAYFDLLYGTPQAADGLSVMKGPYGSLPVRAERTEDGYYVLRNLSGNVLDVEGGRRISGAKVRWYAYYNGTDAQKWLPLENGAIVAKETGLFLTQAEDGSFTASYAKIGSNGKPVFAQSFTLAATAVSIADGSTNVPEWILDTEEPSEPVLTVGGTTLRKDIDYTLRTTVSATEIRYIFSGIGDYIGTLIARTRVDQDPMLDLSAAYRLVSAVNSRKLLTIKDGSLENKANAQIETAGTNLKDLWRFERLSDDTYIIRNLRSGLILDAEGAGRQNGTNIRQYAGNGTAAQRFTLTRNADGSLTIINVNSGKALDIAGGSSADGANVRLYTSNGTKAQRWIPEAAGTLPDLSGRFKIVSAAGSRNKGLSVAGTSKENKANVLTWDAAVSRTALWSVEKNADGSWAIKNVYSGLALDVAGAGRKPGTNVQQYAFGSGNAAQKWVILKNADGTCTIYSVCSGLALDIAGGRTSNGANVQVYTPNGTAAQRWLLTA